MPAPLLMVAATLLFATMGVCVKLASELYAASEWRTCSTTAERPQAESTNSCVARVMAT